MADIIFSKQRIKERADLDPRTKAVFEKKGLEVMDKISEGKSRSFVFIFIYLIITRCFWESVHCKKQPKRRDVRGQSDGP